MYDRKLKIRVDLGPLKPTGDRYWITLDGKLYAKYTDGFKELARTPDPNGYYRVRLYLIDGNHCDMKLHRLILESYTRYVMGPHMDMLTDLTQYDVDHVDRNRTNNDVSNLRWMDHHDHILMHNCGDDWINIKKEMILLGEKRLFKTKAHVEYSEKDKEEIYRSYFIEGYGTTNTAKRCKRSLAAVRALLKSDEAKKWCKKRNITYFYRNLNGGRISKFT